MMIKKAMLIGAIGLFGAQEAQANFIQGISFLHGANP